MKLLAEDDSLTITLEGGEQFWALKRKLVIPKTKIERMDWEQAFAIPRRQLGWRIGTFIPGWLMAGYFGSSFVYIQGVQGLFGDISAKHVLTIQTRDFQFPRIFLTVNNPDIAEQLIAWWAGKD